MDGNNFTLLDFFSYITDEANSYCIGDLFPLMCDSFLTTFLLFFLASWILSICVGIGKAGDK